jgi:hypothetical protein
VTKEARLDDAPAVDRDTIGAPEIIDDRRSVLPPDLGVLAGDLVIYDRQITGRISANGDHRPVQDQGTSLCLPSRDQELIPHRSG